MRRPLQVVYADHSRLEHHGLDAGDVAVMLMRATSWSAEGSAPRMCEIPPWGRISAPADVAPEALEE